MIRLNLLPDEIKKEIEFAKKNAVLLQYLYIIFAVLVCFVGLIFSLSFVLYTQKSVAQDQVSLAQLQIDEQSSKITQAQDLDSRLQIVNLIRKDNVDWQYVFSEIARVTPNNVQIDSFTSPTSTDKARITGKADSEQGVVALKENMATSPLFSFVDIESIVQGSAANQGRELKAFTISYKLNIDKAKR